MSEHGLQEELERARATIRALQDELDETNRGLMALTVELEERVERRTSQLRARAAQQAALAELGRRLLAATDEATALADTAATAAQTLGVRYAMVFADRPARDQLELCAGVGVEGHPAVDRGAGSLAGFALEQGAPVIVEDLASETRFAPCALLRDLGVRSAACVVVPGEGRPFGVLGAYSDAPRGFTRDEAVFLEALAHVLAAALARQRMERELQQTVTELERSNAELEQFAHVASHDLQEPLRMVSSFVQLLARRYRAELDDDANEFIGFAVDGAQRMQRLLGDLLRFSRVTTRGAPPEPTDSRLVLEGVLADLKLALEDSGAEVTLGDLPVVLVDPTQLGQLLQNLLENALKFHGAAAPRIHVAGECADGEAHVTVTDQGIGIDPRFAERVFVVFQRLHTREEFPGTGIGLAVCKKIVERHGGRIWVESAPGEGACFHFTLPCPPPEGATP